MSNRREAHRRRRRGGAAPDPNDDDAGAVDPGSGEEEESLDLLQAHVGQRRALTGSALSNFVWDMFAPILDVDVQQRLADGLCVQGVTRGDAAVSKERLARLGRTPPDRWNAGDWGALAYIERHDHSEANREAARRRRTEGTQRTRARAVLRIWASLVIVVFIAYTLLCGADDAAQRISGHGLLERVRPLAAAEGAIAASWRLLHDASTALATYGDSRRGEAMRDAVLLVGACWLGWKAWGRARGRLVVAWPWGLSYYWRGGGGDGRRRR